MAKAGTLTKRTRRIFSAAFKQGAVRRVQRVSPQQIACDVDVRLEMLRVWAFKSSRGSPFVFRRSHLIVFCQK